MLFSLLFRTAQASTDRDFRKSVIENCDEAARLLPELGVSEKAEVVSYLVLVAKMEAPLLEEPMPQIKENDFFSVVDPDRERKAKQCSLRLLGIFGQSALKVLPQLMELAGDKRFSLVDSSLEAQLEKLIISLIDLLDNDKERKIPERGTIAAKLVPFLVGSQNDLTLRALKVLGKDGIDALFTAIKAPIPSQRQAIVNALIAIDQSDEVVGKNLLLLLQSEDEDLRIKSIYALSELARYTAQAISPLVKRLSDISPSVQDKAASALGKLAKSVEDTNEVGLDDETARALIQAVFRMQGDAQKNVSDAAVRFSKGSKALIESLLSSYSPLLSISTQQVVLKLMGRLNNLPDKGFSLITQQLKAEDLGLRIAAIEALSFQTKRSKEVLDLYSKTLQKTIKTEREKVLIAVAEAVIKLEIKDPNTPLLKYFIESLGIVENEQIARAILSIAKTNPTTIARKLLPLVSSEKIRVRIAARDVLVSLGEAVKPEVTKLLYSKNSKLYAAEILYVLGDRNNKVTELFTKGFQEAPCNEKVSLFSRFIKKDGQDYSFIAEQFVHCVNVTDSGLRLAVIEKLLMLVPLTPKISQKLYEQAISDQTDPTLKFLIFDRVNEFSLPRQQIFEHVMALLNESDSSIKYRAVGILAKIGPGANAAIPKLLGMLNDNQNGDLLKHQLVVAIASIDPNAYDYKRFFSDQLSNERLEWTKHSLKDLGKDHALEILNSVINDTNHPYRENAISCLKEFE